MIIRELIRLIMRIFQIQSILSLIHISLAYHIAKNELGEGYTATEYIDYFMTELSEYLIEAGYSLSLIHISLLRDTYGSKIKVFGTEIPHSVRAKEISAEGKSIFAHDPGGCLLYTSRCV